MERKRILKSAVIISSMVIGIMVGYSIMPSIIISNTDEGTWQIVMYMNSAQAENVVLGSAESGWLSTFLLDYAEVAATVLAANATDWSTDATAMGYVDTDNTNDDIRSNDPFFFVVRARFNQTHAMDDAIFKNGSCACYLTVSGSETITNVLGVHAISRNNSADDFIWINFYWDDGVDGYRIINDGTLAWNITLMAKF